MGTSEDLRTGSDVGVGGQASPVHGILLAFAAFAAFSFSDASVKLIEGAISPYESAFFGAVFGLAALPFLVRPGDRWRDIFRTADRRMWLLRFVAYPVGVMGSVTAFTHLPMAEAFTLMFIQPAFVTIISILFLKEQVGVRRWTAVILGFVGVIVALRPGFRELSIGHLGALLAGLGGAVSVIAFRVAPKGEKNISLFGAGLLGALVLCSLAMGAHFRWPTAEEWGLLAGYGLLAAFANVLLMHAVFRAPATYVAPAQYSQMLWALLLGYLLFGDVIDAPTLVGVALIVGSGILILIRERRRGVPIPPAVGNAYPADASSPSES